MLSEKMNTTLLDEIKSAIREVPDFPKKGINFKDITPIFDDPVLCNKIVDALIEQYKGVKVDAVAGIEARGFLFGMLMANKLEVPFIPIRKLGKLPHKKITYEYALEYGTATVEMHVDAVKKGWNVLVHDDLLATGGTAVAAAELIQTNGSIAGFSFLIDLTFLEGKKVLQSYSNNINSLLDY